MKIIYNKLEITFFLVFIIVILLAVALINCNYLNDIVISPMIRELVFNSTEEKITVRFKILNYTLSIKDNCYLKFKIVDEYNKIVDEGVSDETIDKLFPLRYSFLEANILRPKRNGKFTCYFELYDNKEEKINLSSEENNKITILNEYKLIGSSIELVSNVTNLSIESGNAISIPVSIINNSHDTISNKSEGVQAFLSYHIYDNDNNLLLWDGVRSNFNKSIGIGETLEQNLTINDELLHEIGDYIILVDIVQENIIWLSENGMKPLTINIHVE